MILNMANLATLFRSYNAAFKNAFAQAESVAMKVATEIPSSTEANLYAFLGQFPKMREWIGDRVIKNMASHAYTVTNKPYESTVGVPVPSIEDDTYGVFTPIIQEMAYAAKLHPDELVFALLASGATDLCYDGQPFFSASHPIVVNGVATTTSNYDAVGGGNLWAVMDTRRPLKPLIYQKRKDYKFVAMNQEHDENVFKSNEILYGVDGRCAAGYGLWQLAYGSLNTLNSTNLDAAVTAMMGLKSDEGKPLGIRPNLLVVGPSRRAAARDLIDVSALASGASNPNYKEMDILVSPHLT